ncbi:SWAP/Surp [Nannochloropsis gaditana]|uniref:SWAP/Surp n=1 Tax=Nannochloropsis gaditana TaxID=72520 RepID=W7TP71_9STRA|nr:SWAP/Surp [Nannochloropsis gaditana]
MAEAPVKEEASTGVALDDADVENEIIQGRSGKVTGIIYPPPDIRAVVDKTAQWVARNGKSFEQRILSSEEGKSSKFNFMKPGDPYNAYYEHRIRQFEEGKGEGPAEKKAKIAEVSPPAAGETRDGKAVADTGETPTAVSAAPTTTVSKASVLGPIAKAALHKPEAPPPPQEFYISHPDGLNPLDVEIIKLTAQYTAASGRQFLAALAQREQRNPLFEFLKPSHILFSYFTTLVDAYIKVLQPTDSQRAMVRQGLETQKVLERAVHRWVHEKDEEQRKKQQQAEQEAERVAYQSVDWHDFVVVETITFAEDELLDVGMPEVGGGRANGEVSEDEGEDMELEEEEEALPLPPPPRPPVPPPRPAAGEERGPGQEGEEDMDLDEGEIKVVSSYKPRVAAGGGAARPEVMLDPVTGKEVPIADVGEHMRIQFLDPRWRDEQRRALEKRKESALAEGGDIAANVRSFAKKRTDIFGTSEEEERQILADQERFRARQEENQRMIWQGGTGGQGTLGPGRAPGPSPVASSEPRPGFPQQTNSFAQPPAPAPSQARGPVPPVSSSLLKNTLAGGAGASSFPAPPRGPPGGPPPGPPSWSASTATTTLGTGAATATATATATPSAAATAAAAAGKAACSHHTDPGRLEFGRRRGGEREGLGGGAKAYFAFRVRVCLCEYRGWFHQHTGASGRERRDLELEGTACEAGDRECDVYGQGSEGAALAPPRRDAAEQNAVAKCGAGGVSEGCTDSCLLQSGRSGLVYRLGARDSLQGGPEVSWEMVRVCLRQTRAQVPGLTLLLWAGHICTSPGIPTRVACIR